MVSNCNTDFYRHIPENVQDPSWSNKGSVNKNTNELKNSIVFGNRPGKCPVRKEGKMILKRLASLLF